MSKQSNKSNTKVQIKSELNDNAVQAAIHSETFFLESNHEKIFEVTLHSISDGVISTDKEGRILLMNKTAENLTDWLQAEAIGKNIDDVFIVHDEITNERLNLISNKINKNEEIDIVNSANLVSLNGNVINISISSAFIKDKNYSYGVILIFRDISEQKKIEEQLKENEEVYRTLFEAASDAVFILHGEVFISCNDAATKILKCGAEKITGKAPFDFSPKYQHDGKSSMIAAREKILLALDGLPQTFEWLHSRYDGSVFDTEISLNRIIVQGVIYLQAIVKDITERKKTEEALKESEKRYRTLVDISPNPIIVHTDGIIEYANSACFEVMKAKCKEDIIGKFTLNFVHPDYREIVKERIKNSLNVGIEAPIIEEKFLRYDGEVIDVEVTAISFDNGKKRSMLTMFREITEIKRVQKILKDSEEKYRSYIDNAPDGVLVLNNNGQFIDVNKAFSDIMGYSIEELIHLSIHDLLSEEFHEIGMKHFKKIIEKGKAKEDILHKHKDGSKIWLAVNAIKLSETTILGFVKNITERKMDEEKIKNLNRVYALLSNINQTIVRINNRQELFNEACRITIEDGEFLMAWIGLVNNDTNKVDVTASAGNVGNYLSNINIDLNDKILSNGPTGQAILKGGAYYTIDIESDERMIPWRDDALKHGYRSSIALPIKLSGKVVGAFTLYSSEVGFFNEDEVKLLDELATDISFALDIIEQENIRKNAEKALFESEERYRVIANNSKDIIVKFGTDGKISYVSPACIDKLEIEPSKLIGQSVFRFFHPDEVPRLRIYQEELLNEMAQSIVKHRLRKADGTYIWFESNTQIIHDEDGKIKEVVAICRDISDVVKSAELTKEKEEAELANKAKSEFLANMSHEIRNPLNSIIGLSNMLAKAEMSNENKEMLNSILISSNNLLNIINDILDFSKIEAKKVSIVNVNFDIENIINEIYSIFKPTAEHKKIDFICEFENDVPPVLFGDGGKLKQIIINLTSNAIKFTESGFVKILISKNKIENKKINLKIEISDSGIGIKKKDFKKLFQSFTQLDSSTTKLFSGTGLGLAIIKNLSELMNGNISFASEYGKGSTFTVCIPFEIPVEKQLKEPKKIKTNLVNNKIKILLAEDDAINQLYMKSFLASKGMVVDTAFNGIQAIEKFKAETYDLILMDGQMPRMDGIEATRIIRELEKDKDTHTPIIAITGYAVSGDKENFIAKGMDDYISKPVDEVKLIELIQKHTSEK